MQKFLAVIIVLFITVKAKSQCGNNYQTAIQDGAIIKYTLPVSTIANWQNSSFNDNSWTNGQLGIGYGDGDDNTTTPSGTTAVYVRASFQIADTSAIADAIFNMDYDDAYIAYLNGVPIALSNNINLPTDFNSLATSGHEAQLFQNGLPETTLLPEATLKNIIVPGNNVLAVAVFNDASSSSDLTARPFLHFNIKNTTQYFGSNPIWFTNASTAHPTQLPIMDIQTNGQTINDNTRIIADMRIIDSTGLGFNCITHTQNYFKGKISIELRGSTSQWFPKQPYGFTTVDQAGLDSNVQWYNYSPENDFVLLNTYNDKTFMRDQLAYDFAKELGWYASKTKHIVVYINGNYQGIYLLLEKIKRDAGRVNIQKTDSTTTDITGGYIWKLDKTTGTSGPQFTTSNQGISYQYAYPKFDKITAPQMQYLTNYTNQFESSLYNNNFQNPAIGYRKLANVFSFIDEFLLLELSNNIDGYRLSTFMHKDADANCGRFTKGPVWDYNLSFGNADYCNGGPFGWQISDGCGDGTSKYTLQMLNDPWFKNMTQCRWQNLRKGIFHKDSIFARIDKTSNYLRPEIQYDSAQWQTIGTYIWPNAWIANSWQGEVDSMKKWIGLRLRWMDSVINLTGAICNQKSNNGIVIDEVNYATVGVNTSNDWIELWNSSTNSIDISHYILADKYSKIKYCVLPTNTILMADERLVIYKDSLAFFAQHGNVGKTYGPLCFDLQKEGMGIELLDAQNKIVSSFDYSGLAPWPIEPNLIGTTLQLINPTLDASLAASWKNGCEKGTPGKPQDLNCWPVNINEVTSTQVSIYPNPVQDRLYIHNGNFAASSEVIIYNTVGVTLMKIQYQNIIDVARLAHGMYYIQVRDIAGKQLFVKSFVK